MTRKKERAAMMSKKILTAGLAGLDIDQEDFDPVEMHDGSVTLPDGRTLVLLCPSKFYSEAQVRTVFSEEEIEARKASLLEGGQYQPIVGHPADTSGQNKGKHKINKGECRWRAACRIDGFKLLAVIDPGLDDLNGDDIIFGQLGENNQRADLQVFEYATAFETLKNEYKLSDAEIAKKMGWVSAGGNPSVKKVGRYRAVLKLPEEGQTLVSEGIITDLVSIEILNNIARQDKGIFLNLCTIAKEQREIPRARLQDEYSRLKNHPTENASTHTVAATQKDSDLQSPNKSEKRQDEGANTDLRSPDINAKRQDDGVTTKPKKTVSNEGVFVVTSQQQKGRLVLDELPKSDEHVFIELDAGGLIETKYEDIRIERVSV